MVKSLLGELRTQEFNESFIETNCSATDPNKFDSSTVVNLPNVNQQGFWECLMDGVSVNSLDLKFQGRTAFFDTSQFISFL
jgi:hypothetical protein